MPRVHLENSLQALRKIVGILSGSTVDGSENRNEFLHTLKTLNKLIEQRLKA